ncbi:MAG: glutamine amidotransferase-related protein, partial [Chloroflexota bacterium]
MLVIVDYDAGNLRSVARAVEHAGGAPVVSADPDVVRQARALILPGVGSAAQAMDRLGKLGLAEALRDAAADGIPILGVCLGLQVLLERSEEGGESGTQ